MSVMKEWVVVVVAVFLFTVCYAGANAGVDVDSGRMSLRRYVEQFNSDDSEWHTNAIPNAVAFDFLKENIPLLECPDKDIERAYYFRWWTFRRHIKSTPRGFVVTEFLPDVQWAGKYNTINCAAGHHIMEGRWLKDRRYISDYSRFWFSEGTMTGRRAYVCWPAHAILQSVKVSGETEFATDMLDSLVENWNAWAKGWDAPVYVDRRLHPDKPHDLFFMGLNPNGLFSSVDDREGSENSLSGDGYRPLVNSAMWGEAAAIAEIAGLAGRSDVADDFRAKAAAIERRVKSCLWNPGKDFFTTLSPSGEHRGIRELFGYAPWYFNMPLVGFGKAWRFVVDTKGFFAPCGLTNPEQRAQGYAVGYDFNRSACRRDGPCWPYDTSLALTAFANALRSGDEMPVGPAEYLVLLHQYAAAHRRRLEDGRTVSWIDENLDPFTGEWMARAIFRIQGKKTHYERGKDYNHSTFCDLVISGLCGICPQLDDRIVIRPLASPHWRYFRLSNLFYHGRSITVSWDRTGDYYGEGKGFSVHVDGVERFRSDELPSGCSMGL